MKKNKSKFKVFQSLSSILIGFLFALGFVNYSNLFFENYWLNCLILTLIFLLCYFIHLIIHELGHLIFGLLTGYKFLSFRIFNLMLIKINEKLKFKRLKVAGTAGQCLLIPPKFDESSFPYVLYNLGGVILNSIFTLVSFIFIFITYSYTASCIYYLFFAAGLFVAITNGLPIKTDLLTNDGYNLKYYKKSIDAKKIFYLQLDVNAKLSQGIRYKDMKSKMFNIKNDELGIAGVLKENYFMDLHKFKEAKKQIIKLLNNENLLGLYQIFLKLDLYTINTLLNEEKDETIFNDKQVKAVIKSMGNYPNIIRSLIAKDGYNDKLIEKIYTYPIETEINSELEIIELLRNK